MVGLYLKRSHRTVLAIASILEAGAAYVPLDRSYPRSRLGFIAQDAGLDLLIADPGYGDELELGVPTLELDAECSDVTVGGARAIASDTAYLTYTSGSTGTPKGVLMPHRGVCRSFQWLQSEFPYRPDDRALFKSPIGFDVSSRWEILWPLCAGGAVVVAPPGSTQDPKKLAQTIRERAVTIMHFVPSMLEVFLDEPLSGHCRALRRIFSGGEALSYSLKRRFFARLPGCELVDIYGATETVVVTYRKCSPDDPPHERPIARPIEGLPVVLLDEEHNPVAPGAAGEIYVGGDFLASGYLGLPELSAERFMPSPSSLAGEVESPVLFRTGDWARALDNGEIEHLGRRDHQVKIRGVRVELSEVEAAIETAPRVARAVVLATGQGGRSTRLKAYVRLAAGAAGGPMEELAVALRDHLHALVPLPMVPSEFVEVDAFPLNSNGKVDRAALELVQATCSGRVETLTPTEERVVAVWRRLLGAVEIGREQDFFLIGGDSLLAMRLLTHVRSEFGVTLSPQDLAPGLTVAQLSRWIDAGGASERSPSAMSVEEMLAEVRLDPDVRRVGTPRLGAEPRAIFLTGATGFLGAYLLADLLKETDATIDCLVRGDPASAKERLARARDDFGLSWSGGADRVRPILGDLSRPGLALEAAEFEALGRRIDAIYHVAAKVNEASGYPALRAANVLGTHELLRLANLGAPARVHFVSTTAVFESSGYLAAEVIEDDAPLAAAERVYGGYAQSKWVAEAMLEEARSRGLPVNIYRPGSISGDSTSGHQAWGQTFGSLLRGILAQGAAPEIDVVMTLTPVDFISRAIVHLSRSRWADDRSLNLVNPQGVTMAALVDRARALGHPLDLLPYAEWVSAVSDAIVKDPEHPLSSTLPVLTTTIPGTERSALEWSTLTSRVRCSAVPVLAKAGIRCTPPGGDLLSLYIQSATQTLARR